MKSKIAENIMREYEKRKRYEEKKKRKDLEIFFKENCINCKNKNTEICHIVKNVDNKLSCPFKTI